MYGSLGATRELSRRSLGALWELVAVAGIIIDFFVDYVVVGFLWRFPSGFLWGSSSGLVMWCFGCSDCCGMVF